MVLTVAGAETKKLTVDDVVLLKSVDVEEATILKRLTDSGTTFSAEELEKLRSAGFSEEFMSSVEKLKKPEARGRKLSAADVLKLKALDIPEETILKRIKDSGTSFSAEELKKLKNGGMSDEFIANLSGLPRGEADLKKGREEFRKNVDELGDCFSSAYEAMEEFNRTFEELQSQKKEGKLTQRKFGQSLEKAAGGCGETLEEIHATVLELKQSMDVAPAELKEKKAGTKLAALADQYLATLKEALKALEPVARGTGGADEFESGLETAADLKDKAETAYKAYQAAIEGKTPAEKQVKADFSTPFLAMATFLDACAAKDLNLLSQCFAEQAEEEFQAIRDKKIGPEELDDFVGLFKGGNIASVKEKGSAASVDVKLTGPRDQETFSLVKENGQWKIVEF
jgi:hypothetical protein